jgi:TPR repeat protein
LPRKSKHIAARLSVVHLRGPRLHLDAMPTSPSSVMHTKIDANHGQVDAHSPTALKDAGNDAVRAGQWVRACHMYTLAIDGVVGKSSPQAAADWYALDIQSKGLLHVLFSNRSLTYLNQKDAAAAAEDAEHCCSARPDFVKGHLRLISALAAGEAPVCERREACARALRACPGSKELVDLKVALDREAGVAPGQQACGVDEAAALAAQLAATKVIADDEADPRRALAAGDYGSALALGAHGVRKDLAAAETYLRIGSDGGDAAAARHLGMLLLESDRPAEAVEYLRRAAELGDEEAAATLGQLTAEAQQKREEALFKLRALASKGDERAKAMLESLQNESM